VNGFFDYGPLGSELRPQHPQTRGGKTWSIGARHRGIDCSIISHSKVWEASGHIQGFFRPMVDCKSRSSVTAPTVVLRAVIVAGETIGYVSVLEDAAMQPRPTEKALDIKRKLAKQGALEPHRAQRLHQREAEEYALIPSPATGKPGSLTPPRDFNLMFRLTSARCATRAASPTCGRRRRREFFNFKNVVDTTRVKLPFGIAQIGRSFRNEITPRNFIFRSREFEQMEMEYLHPPHRRLQKEHRAWIDWCKNWLVSIGLPATHLSKRPPKASWRLLARTTETSQFLHQSIHARFPSASRGGVMKYSISICSNSRERKMKLRGVISLRNERPICAMPNGSFTRVVSTTFLKLKNIPCAVSGRR